jgi:hypothetical protein
MLYEEITASCLIKVDHARRRCSTSLISARSHYGINRPGT